MNRLFYLMRGLFYIRAYLIQYLQWVVKDVLTFSLKPLSMRSVIVYDLAITERGFLNSMLNVIEII